MESEIVPSDQPVIRALPYKIIIISLVIFFKILTRNPMIVEPASLVAMGTKIIKKTKYQHDIVNKG